MTVALGARLDLGPCTIPGAECFYCEKRAVHTCHDSRGCVPVCENCARWRAGQSIWPGHMDGCSGEGVAEMQQPSTRRRELR